MYHKSEMKMPKWIKQSLNGLNDSPSIESFTCDDTGLFLTCVFLSQKKCIYFKDELFFRTIDEGCTLKTIGIQFMGEGWFFTTNDSELLDQIKIANPELKSQNIQHFALATRYDTIEVVSKSFPEIIQV